MKINLAKSAGFCFGVKRALNIALKLAQSGQNVEMLGDIVHNENVAGEIYKAGIKKVSALRRGANKVFLIRAHGISKEKIQEAIRLGYRIIDATCPMVKEIHKIVLEAEKKGYRIIIIGDKLHDEVRGIAGQIEQKAIIIDPQSPLSKEKLKKIKKAAIVVQSTQKIETVLKIVKELKRYIQELKFFNTICAPTKIKQQEIKTLPLKNDVVIIIGSRTSANTKRLYEISKLLNQRTYWIQSKQDLLPAWLKGVKKVGITSGASTPASTTQEIINYIRALS
ncbi:MAG: 4-hydroxy-3-methylbut-2-enyl diphosphate reductase [Candidatus Omnitrophica bacterium]|nr:4-hydroxy-3-methylbut-2-enyl diphosphate reductase [Candidatus Omnitrophota bacterium]